MLEGQNILVVNTGGGGAVDSVFGRTGVVVATAGDYEASEVTNTPAGNISAVTVQAAIDELDTEKAKLAGGNTFTGTQTINTTGADKAIVIDNSSTGTGIDLAVNGVLSSISSGMQIYSNAIQTTSTRGLFRVRQDNASSTQMVTEIINDGSGTTLYVDTNGSGYSAIFDGGKVGIGTTAPTEKLFIAGGKIGLSTGGTAFSAVAYPVIYSTQSGGTYPFDSNGNLVLQPRTGGVNQDLVVVVGSGASSSVNAMVVKGTSGNVGIGDTAPGEKLSVTGNISATGTITGSNLSGTNTGDQDLSTLVVGPASATDNAIARFDTTTGKLIQNSVNTIDDTGNMTMIPAGGSTPSAINIGGSGLIIGQVNGNAQVRSAFTGKLFLFKDTASVTKASVDYDTGDISSSGTIIATGALSGSNFSGTHSGTSSGTNTGDQSLFSTIAVSGQSNVVADATSDTLTFVAGTNMTITTDAATDTITFNAAGGSGLTYPQILAITSLRI